jgi:exopolysaccharide biosynthesis polyprenyl glycosylphosphotransferase
MSTVEETTARAPVASTSLPIPAGLPARLRTTREEVVIATGRVAVALVPVLIGFFVVQRTTLGLLNTVALTTIWFLALRSTFDSVWLSPLALGVPTASALGTLTGLAGVTLFMFWFPWAQLRPTELLTMAAGVLVGSAVFETLVVPRLLRPRRVLVVGTSYGGAELVSELLRRPELPFRCLGVVCDEDNPDCAPTAFRLGGPAELPQIMRTERPDLVVLAGPDGRDAAVSTLVDSNSVGFRLVGLPEFYEHAFGRVPIEYISPTWFMSVLHLYQRSYSRVTKRLLDIVLACVGLFVVAPLLGPVAWLVCRSGAGPVLFRQRRLGEGGKPFEMLKFRTMRDGAEEPGQAIWAAEHDPRVTPIGRILRRARLDELPQLWNVLRGDMSIVGPRPERPEFYQLLQREVPYWTRRHLIKPGITGWAQVRCGYASDAGGTAEKLSYDLYYLKHRSLVLDLAITVKTARTVFSGHGVR